MPSHAGRPCSHRGCVRLVHGRDVRYCDEHLALHRREQDARRGTAVDRGYDAKWRAVRDKFLAEHPACVCGERATVAHHDVRRRYGGTDSEDNLVGLCASCHSRLHAKSRESFHIKNVKGIVG